MIRPPHRFASGRVLAAALLLAASVLGSLLPLARSAPTLAQEATPVAAPAGVPATAALVPDDTVVYAVMDTDLASPQWLQTGLLLDRIGVQFSLADLEGMIADAMAAGSPSTPPPDLDAIAGGELAVVVGQQTVDLVAQVVAAGLSTAVAGAAPPVATPSPAGPFGVTVLLRPGDPDAAWTYIQQLIEDLAAASGETVGSETHEGVEILLVPPTPSESSPSLAFARVADAIVAAASAQDVYPLIETAAGDRPSLAASDNLGRVRAELPDEALFFSYVDGARLYDALGDDLKSYLEATSPALADQAALSALTGAVLFADDAGFRMESVSLAAPGGSLPDQPDNFDPTMDERLPGDTLYYAGGYDLGATGALDPLALSIAQLVTVGMAEGTPVADVAEMFSSRYVEEQFAAAEQALGFDLRDDFVRQLAGEYAFAASLKSTRSPLGLSALLVSGVADAATLEASLDEIDRLIQDQAGGAVILSTREVEGGRLHTVDASDPDSGLTLGALGLEVEYGVVADQFLLGAGGGLKSFLEGPENLLSENRRYQRVMAELPADYNTVVYLDAKQLAPFVELGIFALQQGVGEVTEGIDDIGGDADPACAAFASQEAAQSAYDEDPFANAGLDQDFDGEACEDFFAPPTPAAATPTPALSTLDLDAVESFAAVTYEEEDRIGASAILLISES